MSPRHAVTVSIFLIAAPLMAAPALADEIQRASFTPREMAHCMMKRFRAHHAESYRDAYNACKEQFDLGQELGHPDRGETVMNQPATAEHTK